MCAMICYSLRKLPSNKGVVSVLLNVDDLVCTLARCTLLTYMMSLL